MNRLAVFAHFDKNEKIGDYVVFYLKALKEFCDKIIFISAANVAEDEKNKIKDLCEYIETIPHDEYDFGSYKRGFLYLKNNNLLNDADRLIFANDSCYAPIFPFADMFNTMDKKKCDFWGVTKNNFDIDGNMFSHLQSYFLSFNKNIFLSDVFNDFICSVKAEPDKFNIVRKYEQGLTKVLNEAGFFYECYTKNYDVKSPHILKWKELITQDKSPFLKANVIRLKEYRMMYPFGWESILSNNTPYPLDLIVKDLNLNKNTTLPVILAYQYFRKKILRIHPKTGTIYLFGKEIKF